MINNKECFLSRFTIMLLLLLLSGCADTVKNMRVVPPDRSVSAPEKGKSMVVFIRPSIFGATLESGIFEIKSGVPSLIGTIVATQKLSYQLEPGKHLFMMAANNVDYLLAELKPNKTYYVYIAPIMGRWIGRFSMAPMPINRIYSPQFYGWLKKCDEVEKIAATDNEADDDMVAIKLRHEEHYEKWASEHLSEKVRLLPRDGK